MQGIFFKIRYFKRELSKSFKKVTLIFFQTACHPYVVRMYSYVIRMSLVFARMSSVCHSYVLVCHPDVTRMWLYHEPYFLYKYLFSREYIRESVSCSFAKCDASCSFAISRDISLHSSK